MMIFIKLCFILGVYGNNNTSIFGSIENNITLSPTSAPNIENYFETPYFYIVLFLLCVLLTCIIYKSPICYNNSRDNLQDNYRVIV